MSDLPIRGEDFRREVADVASALTARGFKHSPGFDTATATSVSVAYVGRNVAFAFTLDIRDQSIDLVVTRCRNGQLVATQDDGYSSSLFTHLVTHCGFRGRPTPSASLPPSASNSQRALSSLVGLLTHSCSNALLADRDDSLPQ